MSLGPESDAIVQQYVRRVSELSRVRRQLPSQQELEAIALEVGIAPEVLEQARQTAQAHFNRGVDYRQQDQWDAAIAELENSLALNPSYGEAHYQLAMAYQGRYRQLQLTSDRQAALDHLADCLSLQPDHAAARALQSSLAHAPKPASNSTTRLPLLIGTGVGLVVAMGVGTSLLLLQGQSPEATSIVVEDAPLPADASATTAPLATDSPSAETGEVDIPLLLADDLGEAGIAVEVRQSRLSNYPERSFYNLSALLLNESNQELEKVTLVAELLDDQGQIVSQKTLRALDSQHPTLRPGDRFPFTTIEETTPSVAQVRLRIQTLDGLPAASNYDPGEIVPVRWEVEQRPQWQLEARERQLSASSSILNEGEAYVEATFAITNVGDASFQTLKLVMRMYDAAGNQLGEDELLVVYGDNPPLLPGESRPEKALESIPVGFHSYELVVVEVE
jgi:tetratricopeptide (TPR) repeat protein